MNRRLFLKSLAASSLLLPSLNIAAAKLPQKTHYFSARGDLDGRYFISAFDEQGKQRFDVLLPSRGHAIAVHPLLNHVVAVARRPETYLIVIDGESGQIIHHHESDENRHFYGHSVFSPDGRWLYTTENNIENGQGMIGVRDVMNNYRQVAEFKSHGIGPHELDLLSDGETLVVANGGILTRPETGRSKLNLDTMSPSLAYINANNGSLLEQHKLPANLHQNSIRHFAINRHDQVCFAMQYQGNASHQPPLVGLHRRGQPLQLMHAPAGIQQQMRNYCGSVCKDSSGHWFAVSSPRGNLITFWSARDAQYVSSVTVEDGCGIASGQGHGEFFLSSGTGGVFRYFIQQDKLTPVAPIADLKTRWDNHISRRTISTNG